LSCEDAAYSGTAEATEQVVVMGGTGKRTVSRKEAIALAASRTYSIGKGNDASVELRLTSSGAKLLADAKLNPSRGARRHRPRRDENDEDGPNLLTPTAGWTSGRLAEMPLRFT
jgi:hypothetical protein